jgi:predicted membrane-bound spermidine synthase
MNVRGEVKTIPNGRGPGTKSYRGLLTDERGRVVYDTDSCYHQADAINRLEWEVKEKGYTVIPWTGK